MSPPQLCDGWRKLMSMSPSEAATLACGCSVAAQGRGREAVPPCWASDDGVLHGGFVVGRVRLSA